MTLRPVCACAATIQKSSTRQQERAGTDGGGDAGRLVHGAQPGQHAFVVLQQARAEAAGDKQQVAVADLIDALIRRERQKAVVAAHEPALRSHETQARSWQPRQYLVGPHRIESGELVEDQDDDVHGLTSRSCSIWICRSDGCPRTEARTVLSWTEADSPGKSAPQRLGRAEAG